MTSTYKREQIKRINLITVLAVMLCALFFCITPVVRATNVTPGNGGATTAQNNEVQKAEIKAIVQDNMFNTSILLITGELGGNLIPYALGTYSDDGTPTGGFGLGGDLLSGVFMTFKAIGFLLSIAVALGHYFQRIERGEEGFQPVYKVLMEIAIVGLIIMNLEKIIGLLIKVGLAIICEVAAPAIEASDKYTDADLENILQALTGSKTGASNWQAKVTNNIGVFGTGNIITDIVTVTIYCGFAIEIGVRRLFAPLAVADIYQEGLRSSGARYIKKIFASVLKLAMSLAVSYFIQITGKRFDDGIWDAVKRTGTTISSDLGDVRNSIFNGGGISLDDLRGGIRNLGQTAADLKMGTAETIYQMKMALAFKLGMKIAGLSAMSKTGEIANDVMGV